MEAQSILVRTLDKSIHIELKLHPEVSTKVKIWVVKADASK